MNPTSISLNNRSLSGLSMLTIMNYCEHLTENQLSITKDYDDNRIRTVTLPSSEVITFTYFADGSRATKESSTEWITYHYATGLVKEVHHLASDHNTTTFTLHYEPGRIIYEPNQGTPTTYYTVTDTQGTIYKLLDSSGTTVASYTYDPFGNRLTNSAPTIYNPIGFAGTYHDQETNLLYASSRYLDPTTSRFTTKDSYRGDLQSHISQNRYIYCHQNPISYSDPSGFAPIEGDNSNSTPTSTTRTKTEHKEKVEPPENEVNAKKPIEFTPMESETEKPEIDMSKLKEGHNFFKININGVEITIRITVRNGKVTQVTGSVPQGTERKYHELANGIADALAGDPAVMNEFLGDPSGFGVEMNRFFKNFDTFVRIMGNNNGVPDIGRMAYDFGYHATRGYAIASIIEKSGKNPITFDMCWRFGHAHGEGYTPFEYSMMAGFWSSFINSKLGLNLSLTSESKGWNTELSVELLARTLMGIWTWETRGGLDNGDGALELELKKAALLLGIDKTDTIQNNSLDIMLKNIIKMNGILGMHFSTDKWTKVSQFEAFGMGACWMGLLLNTVRGSWTQGSNKIFCVRDLAVALRLFNNNTENDGNDAETGQFWRDILCLAIEGKIDFSDADWVNRTAIWYYYGLDNKAKDVRNKKGWDHKDIDLIWDKRYEKGKLKEP